MDTDRTVTTVRLPITTAVTEGATPAVPLTHIILTAARTRGPRLAGPTRTAVALRCRALRAGRRRPRTPHLAAIVSRRLQAIRPAARARAVPAPCLGGGRLPAEAPAGHRAGLIRPRGRPPRRGLPVAGGGVKLCVFR